MTQPKYAYIDKASREACLTIKKSRRIHEVLVAARLMYSYEPGSRAREDIYKAMRDRIHMLHGRYLTSTVEIMRRVRINKLKAGGDPYE